MKRAFLTFASSDISPTLKRIHGEAELIQVYDQIITMTERDLDTAFRNRFRKQLHHGTRGYGYWSWKPQCILQALEELDDGDLLQYTDAGCQLRVQGKPRLMEYFNMAEANKLGVLAFQAISPETPLAYDGRKLPDSRNCVWTKGDLLERFNVRNRDDVLQAPAIGAGILFIRKCPQSISLIQQWLDVILEDFSLIDDSPSQSENQPEFIEHRHDQSIFSILALQNDVQTVSSYEYMYPSATDINDPDWEALKDFPIHAKRLRKRSLISKLRRLFLVR